MEITIAKKELEDYRNRKHYLSEIKKEAQKPKSSQLNEIDYNENLSKLQEEILSLTESVNGIRKKITDKIQRLEMPYNTILFYRYISILNVSEIADSYLYSEEYVRRLIRKGIELYSKL